MAAHVMVIDSTARSAKIKTVPGKHLTDILEEACTKLGRDASRYELKCVTNAAFWKILLMASCRYKNKPLDLSRTMMLSGLSGGAKLELVTASRSPSVVSVALQLPEVEPDGTARLTDKFPSTTTLWLILRKFESVKGSTRNLTGRNSPLNKDQTSGSGRLYFETPVITAMNRELASFTDLQKTLAQLGVNSGSILLRLSFRQTEKPLEEAIAEIGQYFKEIKGEETNGTHATSLATNGPNPSATIEGLTADATKSPTANTHQSPEQLSASGDSANDAHNLGNTDTGERRASNPDPLEQVTEQPPVTVTGPSQRPISIFAPPSSSTPKAALQKEHDKDFEPTLDHMKSHQKYLQTNTQNKTLKSDAQLAAEAQDQAEKASRVKGVEIKLRFPDQSQVSATFTNSDTASTLHEHARGLMRNPQEPISLTFRAEKGRQIIPADSDVRLIQGLGLMGRVLVDVGWGDGASLAARQEPTLKEEFRAKAQEIPVPQMSGSDNVGKESGKEAGALSSSSSPSDVNGKAKERKGGMPKWFKGIGGKMGVNNSTEPR